MVAAFIANSLKPYTDALIDQYTVNNPTLTEGLSQYLSQVIGTEMTVDETSVDTAKETLFGNILNSIKARDYNLEDTVFNQYFETNQVIDNELFKILKTLIYNSIKNKYPILQSGLSYYAPTPDGEMVYWSLTSQDLDNFDNILIRGLDSKQPLATIIQEFADKVISDIENGEDEQAKAVIHNIPNFKEDFVNKVNAIITSPLTEKYNLTITKEIKTNPLYDRLRDLDFQLNDGNAVSIFNLLENESTYLSGISSIEDYLRAPDIAEQLDNAQRVLNTMKALVAGMDGTPISYTGHLFGYNAQIRE